MYDLVFLITNDYICNLLFKFLILFCGLRSAQTFHDKELLCDYREKYNFHLRSTQVLLMSLNYKIGNGNIFRDYKVAEELSTIIREQQFGHDFS